MKSINSTLLHSGRTSIFIAHRLRTVVEAGRSISTVKSHGVLISSDIDIHRPDHSSQGRPNRRGGHARGTIASGWIVPRHVDPTVVVGQCIGEHGSASLNMSGLLGIYLLSPC